MAYYKVNAGDLPLPSDVNQYADGLTGNNDVGALTLAASLSAPSSGPTAALATGSALAVGTYQYAYTYVTGYKKGNTLIYNGETPLSPATSITTTSGNQIVNLTNITTNAASYVIARRIYRTKVNPSAAPTLSASGTGNTLTAGTYYVKYTWVFTGGGESLPSPEASQAVTSGQQLTVTIPAFPTGVASANIYVSTSTGTETLQRNITTTSTSFTAPISSGAAMPTVTNFYKLTEISDNSTTTYTDNTADTSLTIAAPTGNTTGTYFNTIYVGNDQRGQLFANGNTMVHMQNLTGSLFNEAKLANYICANSYYDGTNWQRFDTTQPASSIVIQTNGQPQFRSVGAGANPITWNLFNLFHEGNFNTRTHILAYMGAASQGLVLNSWNRVLYDTIIYDYLNEFTAGGGTSYFTALNTGIYMVSFGVRIIGLGSAGTANFILGTNQLNRSGNAYNVFEDHNNAATVQYFATQVLYMSAGTQLECRVWQDSGTAGTIATGQSNTWLNISRIA